MRLIRYIYMIGFSILASVSLTSCSDEPDGENFYTFTGEMASDYLKNRSQYSQFSAIVERAGLMDLLSTYGKYTCFVPNDSAVTAYLSRHGKNSVSDLSREDCDTIARTHLVANMYSTMEMTQDRLATANMLGRYIATSSGFDADGNAVQANVYNGSEQRFDLDLSKAGQYKLIVSCVDYYGFVINKKYDITVE